MGTIIRVLRVALRCAAFRAAAKAVGERQDYGARALRGAPRLAELETCVLNVVGNCARGTTIRRSGVVEVLRRQIGESHLKLRRNDGRLERKHHDFDKD